MESTKRMRLAVTWCLSVACAAWAGRPLTVDDADPVDCGLAELEAGVGSVYSPGCRHWDVPLAVTYGVCRGVEAGVGFGQQFEKRLEFLEEKGGERHVHKNGIGDLVAGAKWQFVGEGTWWPRQAVVPSVKFPTADEGDSLGSGEIDYDLMWVASKALTERMGAHANLGYSWIGEPDDENIGNVVHGGLALDYQLADPLQWVGEVFAEDEVGYGGGTAVQYNVGLRWAVTDGLILDAAAGSRICGDGAPDVDVRLAGRRLSGRAVNQ